MQIIERSSFVTARWRNGGGVTHEVARREANGRMIWRISIAEVERDGPFSLFTGYERILTVIEGNGMTLHHTDSDRSVLAKPFEPVRFSGDAAIDGKLIDGPCRDFNLIFDLKYFEARLTVARAVEAVGVAGQSGGMTGIYCVSGRVTAASGQTVRAGSFAIAGAADLPMTLSKGGSALWIEMRER